MKLPKERTTITPAEWEVMRVIWAKEEISSREIIDILTPLLHWKEGTIKSLISRLTQKGMIEKNTQSSPYLYHTLINQEEAIHQQLTLWLYQTCSQTRGQSLIRLVQDQPLSQSDCQQLIQELEERLESAPAQVVCDCPLGQCTCHYCHHS